MKRQQRLQSARSWLKTYTGKKLVRGYARWYGVDPLCAVSELRMLGVSVSREREQDVARSLAERARQRRLRKEARQAPDPEFCPGAEPHDIYYVAGWTEGGAPYGLTRDEYERECAGEPPAENDEPERLHDRSDNMPLPWGTGPDDQIPF